MAILNRIKNQELYLAPIQQRFPLLAGSQDAPIKQTDKIDRELNLKRIAIVQDPLPANEVTSDDLWIKIVNKKTNLSYGILANTKQHRIPMQIFQNWIISNTYTPAVNYDRDFRVPAGSFCDISLTNNTQQNYLIDILLGGTLDLETTYNTKKAITKDEKGNKIFNYSEPHFITIEIPVLNTNQPFEQIFYIPKCGEAILENITGLSYDFQNNRPNQIYMNIYDKQLGKTFWEEDQNGRNVTSIINANRIAQTYKKLTPSGAYVLKVINRGAIMNDRLMMIARIRLNYNL
jgi:hypothetical protein